MMYVERDIKQIFDKLQEPYNMIALVGARQSGKTTFLKEQMKDFSSTYILFDDPDVREFFEEDVKKFEIRYMNGFDLTVLDEVQYCQDAGGKLKYLVDSGRRMWITSSSEMILSKEILAYLVGRVSVQKLFPFNIREFQRAKGENQLTSKIKERMVWEHLIYGGYPKVVLTTDPEVKKVILSDLKETMLLKDVARSFNIDDLDTLEKFTRYLALNSGSIVSYANISKTLGISFPTLKKYLFALEKSYLIVSVPPYFTNKNKEITKQPKIFFLDTGMRSAAAGTYGTEPDGKLFENYVVNEVVKMGFTPRYWRTKSKAEVDIVIEVNGKVIPLEVKLKAAPPRIERSLKTFIETYAPKEAFVISYTGGESEISINGCKVFFTDIFGLWDKLRSK